VIANAQEGNKILYLDGGKHGKVANGSESLIMESMRSWHVLRVPLGQQQLWKQREEEEFS